jgi:branched-chain amino acid transport system permease protein
VVSAAIGTAVFVAGFGLVVLVAQKVVPSLPGASSLAEPIGNHFGGVVLGLLSALVAVGLVLIYRTNRIINFAQGGLGGMAATAASELFQVFHWPYVFAVLSGLAVAVLMSMAVEFLLIRRFHRAPRLILTVATIGVAQILGAFELIMPYIINRDRDAGEFQTILSSPFSVTKLVGGVTLKGDHFVVLVVAPVILAGLFIFLRFTRYGVAARGVAENRDRARLLGVRVKRVSLIVWALAGLLSALTAILQAPITGFQFGAIGGVGLLYRALAAAVIGRMESLPITAGAAILLTVAEQTIFWYYNPGVANGFLLVVVVVALLLQRNRLGRVDPGSSSWQAVQEVRPVPSVLRKLPEVRWARWGGGAAVLLFVVALPLRRPYGFGLPASKSQLVSVLFIYGMIGISLVMLTGWSGNVSLGHWAITGFGALTAGALATRAVPFDFFLSLLVAALVGAGISVLVGIPALRIRGLFLGITTLALAVAASELFFQWDVFIPDGVIGRPILFGLIDATTERVFYFVCLAFLLLTMWAGRNFRYSRLGRVLIAMRDNEAQAQSYGIRPMRMKLMAFGISGFLAALAGGLYAYHQQTLGPGRFPAERSLLIFSMIVIGGMGSMAGALLGAVYVIGTINLLPSEFQLLATGFGMLFLLMVFPGGLGQILYSWRDRYLRWVADRRGLIVPSLIADKRTEEEQLVASTGRPHTADLELPDEVDLLTAGDRP